MWNFLHKTFHWTRALFLNQTLDLCCGECLDVSVEKLSYSWDVPEVKSSGYAKKLNFLDNVQLGSNSFMVFLHMASVPFQSHHCCSSARCLRAHCPVCNLATTHAWGHHALCWPSRGPALKLPHWPTSTAKSQLPTMTPHSIFLRAQFSTTFMAFNVPYFNQLWRWHLLWLIVRLKGRKCPPLFLSSETSTSVGAR